MCLHGLRGPLVGAAHEAVAEGPAAEGGNQEPAAAVGDGDAVVVGAAEYDKVRLAVLAASGARHGVVRVKRAERATAKFAPPVRPLHDARDEGAVLL